MTDRAVALAGPGWLWLVQAEQDWTVDSQCELALASLVWYCQQLGLAGMALFVDF